MADWVRQLFIDGLQLDQAPLIAPENHFIVKVNNS